MNANNSLICVAATWAVAFLAGVAVAALLMVLGGWSFMQGAFIGAIVFLVLGGFLVRTMCGALPAPGHVQAGHTAVVPVSPARTLAEAVPAHAPVAPAAEPAAQPAARPAAQPAAAAAAVPAGAATKPSTLSAPRGGGADDLKKIKGVGPKLEAMLHGMGFYHFDQIAAWTAREVAWVDDNLEGFKGRVSRDKWVEQAKLLAAGGETEFSKRVGKGEVY
jgi:predicted flap endonuclease-1-like 5' DNA nuclease